MDKPFFRQYIDLRFAVEDHLHCVSKTPPTFLAVTRESIIGLS